MHNIFNRAKIAAALVAASFLAPATAAWAQYSDSTQYSHTGIASTTLWDANGFGSQMQTIVNNTVNTATTANNTANTAYNTAVSANNTANTANSTANNAYQMASGAASTAGQGNTVPGFWTPSANNPVVIQGICSSTNHSYYPVSSTAMASPVNNPQNGSQGTGYWPGYSTRQVCPTDMPWFYQISTYTYDTSNQGGGT